MTEKCFDAYACAAPELGAQIAKLRKAAKVVYEQLIMVGSVANGDVERLEKAIHETEGY